MVCREEADRSTFLNAKEPAVKASQLGQAINAQPQAEDPIYKTMHERSQASVHHSASA
jgi:hypothetical protein